MERHKPKEIEDNVHTQTAIADQQNPTILAIQIAYAHC